MAERLNSLGAQNWRRFAGQDYFDPGGVFLSAVLCAPLVFTMFVILVSLLVRGSSSIEPLGASW